MEEARQQREIEIEEKRRCEERQHEMSMMQMMGNMFMQVAANFNQPQPQTFSASMQPNFYNGRQQQQIYQHNLFDYGSTVNNDKQTNTTFY